MPKQEPKKQEEQNTFDTIVEAIDQTESDPDRHLSIQLDNTLREAIRAAKNSGKKSSVTLKVDILPGANTRAMFAATVNAKLPKPPVNTVDFFTDSEGGIFKSDPRQIKMFQQPSVSGEN